MSTITHNVNRIVLDATCSFEEMRKRFEAAVPPLDLQLVASLVQPRMSWNDITTAVNTHSPSGFFVFWEMDVMSMMRLAGHEGSCVEYLIGNYAVAERMFRWDRSAMLHAPLRTLIYTDGKNNARVAIDQPSSVFSSFNNDALAEVGKELDRKLGALFKTLDLPESAIVNASELAES